MESAVNIFSIVGVIISILTFIIFISDKVIIFFRAKRIGQLNEKNQSEKKNSIIMLLLHSQKSKQYRISIITP